MDTLKGYISSIIYENSENGYKVCRFETDDGEETIVGNLPGIGEGEMLELTGEWTVHRIYDKQFKVINYKSIEPEDNASMERYLGSGIIKGIGPSLAKRIVKEFGTDSFRVIENEPERLAIIKGISLQKAREIGIVMHEKRGYRDAIIFLQKYGISNTLAIKIYSFYQDRIYKLIEENPYKLAEDIAGVGFKTADEIAAKIGVRADSDYRIQSAIQYTLLLAMSQGHMYLPRKDLVTRTANIIGVDELAIEPHILNLVVDKKLLVKVPTRPEEDEIVYASSNFYVERSAAAILRNLQVDFYDDNSVSELMLSKRIDAITLSEEMELDDIQKKAVMSAVCNGLSIITGGPGTGKTTTINTIIKYFKSEGLDIALAAPTGRAAKRMTEATGYEAKTIHRMLEINGAVDEEGKGAKFERNESNPIEADVIIVDEMSMVDIFLFQALLKAVMPGCRLIMVGDADQLPSVGPGQVLRDLIESKCFPVTRLERIFRQEGNADIVANAHKINHGEKILVDNKSKDFFFLKRDDVQRVLANTVELMTQMLPSYVGATPFDIQVLTPTRKGVVGVEALNKYIQDKLNPADPGKNEHMYGEILFREGDKVMQIKNNYKAEWEIVGKYNIPIDAGMGIFNGDMGRVKKIDNYNNSLTVEFDDKRLVDYAFSDLDELELAYAITIHKSQGSEYAAVVMPIMPGPRQLMNRNLLYTGVTRAKSCLVMLGDEEILNEMIENNHEHRRYSGLKERIIEIMAE
ncbi:MAG: ATP-dependent RecD-like DNA helicase [Lachnospiraceae bacterium]|nr:ATP-dependent RecD-like DNA helicase [Lachnospiraceae bacterium]